MVKIRQNKVEMKAFSGWRRLAVAGIADVGSRKCLRVHASAAPINVRELEKRVSTLFCVLVKMAR